MNLDKIKMMREGSIADYRKAEAAYKQARLKAIDANDTTTLDKLDKLMETAQNYSAGDPMNSRDARQYRTELYKNAVLLADGRDAEVSGSGITPAKDAFGFGNYTRSENKANADNVTAAYLQYNNQAEKDTKNAAAQNQPTYNLAWFFDANKGLNSNYDYESTLGDRIDSYRNQLIANLNDALAAKDRNYQIQGLDSMQLSKISGDIAKLKNLNVNSESALRELSNIARQYDLDGSTFKNYFKNFIKKSDDNESDPFKDYTFMSEQQRSGLSNELRQYLDANNYTIANKDGKSYIVKKDKSGLGNQEYMHINQDNTSADFGHGFYTDALGNLFTGNLLDTSVYNPYRQAIDNYIKNNLYDKNSNRYYYQSVDGLPNKPVQFNQITDYANSDDDLVNTFASDLHGKQVVDVSGYFGGTPAIATFADNNIFQHIDPLGNIKFDDSVTLYINGQQIPYSQFAANNINLNFTDDSMHGNAASFISNASTFDAWRDLNSDEKTQDLNGYTGFYNMLSGRNLVTNPFTGETLDSNRDMIGSKGLLGKVNTTNNYQTTGRLMLAILTSPDSFSAGQKTTVDRIYDYMMNNPWIAAKIMYQCIQSGGLEQLTPEIQNKFITAFRQFNIHHKPQQPMVVEKDGGILKAASGTALNAQGQSVSADMRNALAKQADERFLAFDALKDRADAEGYSTRKQKSIEEGWSALDTLRATALATDIAGLIAAISSPATAGVGSLIAVGSGFASMAQDAAADFTDDKVSAGQAWKNLGINAGLAATAAFGSKAVGITGRIAKFLPKAMMAIGTAGVVLDPEVQKSVGKAVSGKSLNVNDWRNISIALRTATGLATVKTINYKAKKGQTEWARLRDKNLAAITSEADPNIKYVASEDGQSVIPLQKQIYDTVNGKLKTGKPEDLAAAMELLTRAKAEQDGGAGLTNELAEAVLQRLQGKKSGWDRVKLWKKGPEEVSLRDATPSQISTTVAPDLRAAANLKTINEVVAAHPMAKNYNPVLNAAVAESKKYANVRQMIAGEQSKLKPISPYAAEESDLQYTADEMEQAKKSVSNFITAESKRLRTAENLSSQREVIKKQTAEISKLQEKEAKLAESIKLAKSIAADAENNFRLAEENYNKSATNRSQLETQMIEAETKYKNALDALRQAEADYRLVEDILNSLDPNALMHNENVRAGIATRTKAIQKAENALNELLNSQEFTYYLRKDGKPGSKLPKALRDKYNLAKAEVDARKQDLLDFLSHRDNRISRKKVWDDFVKKRSAHSLALKTLTEATESKRNIESQLSQLREELRLAEERKNAASKFVTTLEEKASTLTQKRTAKTEKMKEQTLKLIDSTKRVREGIDAERTKRWREVGKQTSITTGSNVTVVIEGKLTTIPSGTKTRSFTSIRDAQQAKNVVLSDQNAKELSRSEIEKIYPSNISRSIRGAAYNKATGNIDIWKQGGLVTSKFSHLRK